MRLRLKKPVCVWRGLGLLVLIFSLFVVNASAQPTPESPVPLPVPFTPIVDNANVIDAATKQKLETIYYGLKERANIEYAVVTVDTTGDRDILTTRSQLRVAGALEQRTVTKLVSCWWLRYVIASISHKSAGILKEIYPTVLSVRFNANDWCRRSGRGITAKVSSIRFKLTLPHSPQKRGFSIEGIDQSQAFRRRNATACETATKSRNHVRSEQQ